MRNIKKMAHSFDIIGDIAIVQIPKNEKSDEKKIAQDIMKKNHNVKTVYGRGKFKGRLRKQDIKFILGEKKEETIYKENSCLIKLNVKTCYFSPRLGSDRKEIAEQIKKNENVLVMFSGVAPYGVIISKYSKAKKICCVELNREATKYAIENIKLNKLQNCEAIQGDVKKICPKFKKQKLFFDKIVMARPQLKDPFLKEAFMIAKKGSIVYFYDFQYVDHIEESYQILEQEAKKAKRKYKIINLKKVREIGPRKYQLRFDLKVLN
ncbi:hypothetical protein J4465_00460 [Candidatus Pacearchaeota archaeon]|nr:hypothetical protein [Candidatus Pacearchaeota archaeon]